MPLVNKKHWSSYLNARNGSQGKWLLLLWNKNTSRIEQVCLERTLQVWQIRGDSTYISRKLGCNFTLNEFICFVITTQVDKWLHKYLLYRRVNVLFSYVFLKGTLCSTLLLKSNLFQRTIFTDYGNPHCSDQASFVRIFHGFPVQGCLCCCPATIEVFDHIIPRNSNICLHAQ